MGRFDIQLLTMLVIAEVNEVVDFVDKSILFGLDYDASRRRRGPKPIDSQ